MRNWYGVCVNVAGTDVALCIGVFTGRGSSSGHNDVCTVGICFNMAANLTVVYRTQIPQGRSEEVESSAFYSSSPRSSSLISAHRATADSASGLERL